MKNKKNKIEEIKSTIIGAKAFRMGNCQILVAKEPFLKKKI